MHYVFRLIYFIFQISIFVGPAIYSRPPVCAEPPKREPAYGGAPQMPCSAPLSDIVLGGWGGGGCGDALTFFHVGEVSRNLKLYMIYHIVPIIRIFQGSDYFEIFFLQDMCL
jgi:hypothetical protein